jgi:hypothetical protein
LMRLNEYLYQSNRQAWQRAAKRREEEFQRKKDNHKRILDRIANNPEQYDLERGDALNSLFESLADPQVASSFRLSPVPLAGEVVRAIPFFYGPEDATISMQRIATRGKWPVGFRGDAFASERRAYEQAIDTALEQQIEGKLSREAIQAVATAVYNLAVKLDQVIPPSRDKVYLEAKNHLKRLETAKELIKRGSSERILSEIDKYSGTTVHDLVVFMQKHNLRFGVPDPGDERELYPRLYASLRLQLDSVAGSRNPTP